MDTSERMMLVYEHKANGRKLVPNGVSIMTEEDIVMAISSYPDVIMLTKAIQAGQTHIDLYKVDLLTDDQKAAAVPVKAATNREAEIENVSEEVPWRVFLGYEWEGHSFEELVILTPDGTLSARKMGEEAKAGEEMKLGEETEWGRADMTRGCIGTALT